MELQSLPIRQKAFEKCLLPLKLTPVKMPAWASKWSVDGFILVPKEACSQGNDWEKTDWWLALFLMMECWHERVWESINGPVHSYSFRLKGWDARVWDRPKMQRVQGGQPPGCGESGEQRALWHWVCNKFIASDGPVLP